MARRSGGGRSARPAVRPVRNPPQPAKRAPPPAPAATSSSGGSMLKNLGATIADGLAFGTGNAVGHRAVEAVMGPRTVQYEWVANEAAAGASPACANNTGDACGIHNKAFQDCLDKFGSEISRCQFYLDMLSECRKNSGSINA